MDKSKKVSAATKRAADKNVISSIGNKNLVRVQGMPQLITTKTDGWIEDDLQLMIVVGSIINNYRRMSDIFFYEEKTCGKMTAVVANVDIEMIGAVFVEQLAALKSALNASEVGVNAAGSDDRSLTIFIRWN